MALVLSKSRSLSTSTLKAVSAFWREILADVEPRSVLSFRADTVRI